MNTKILKTQITQNNKRQLLKTFKRYDFFQFCEKIVLQEWKFLFLTKKKIKKIIFLNNFGNHLQIQTQHVHIHYSFT